MGGITSASVPMLVVEKYLEGNGAYCNLNERHQQSDALRRVQ